MPMGAIPVRSPRLSPSPSSLAAHCCRWLTARGAGHPVHWRVVAVSGAAAWLLALASVAAVASFGQPPSRPAPAAAAATPAEPIGPPTPTREALAAAKAPEPAGPQPGASKPSFRKAPVSPPLPEGAGDERGSEPPVPSREAVLALPSAPGGGLPVSERPVAGEDDVTANQCGTSVMFVGNPTEAARIALKARKMLFVIHLSGDFDDDKFT